MRLALYSRGGRIGATERTAAPRASINLLLLLATADFTYGTMDADSATEHEWLILGGSQGVQTWHSADRLL